MQSNFGKPIAIRHQSVHADARPSVVGPDGVILSYGDLPPAGTRWVMRRKAEVVAAVKGGMITREEARQRYNITDSELDNWFRLLEKGSTLLLRATFIQSIVREQSESITALQFASATDSVEKCGSITIDYKMCNVHIDGFVLHLPKKEYDMLELLFLLRGQTVSREMFLDHMYQADEPGLKIIDVLVCKLKKKIPPGYIKTAWGRGYVLAAPEP